MPLLELPAPIMAELRAANARRVTAFDGPKGQQFHLWMGGARENVALIGTPVSKLSCQSPRDQVYHRAVTAGGRDTGAAEQNEQSCI